MLTKAMIMAAGVGSRLEPLSSIVPKPLVPVVNIPVMDILVKHLASNGVKDIISNTYHKAEYIQSHYAKSDFNVNIQFIKEEKLSGTAGGVRKCRFFFDEGQDFIVLSGDGLSDININEAYNSHKLSGSPVTIIAKEIEHKEVHKYGIIVTDKDGYVASFQEKPSLKDAKSNLANTGIYIFNYKIFDFIPENTFYDFAKNVFPSILSSGIKINTYIHKGYWSDIGSIEQYKQSNIDVINKKVSSAKVNVVVSGNSKYVSKDTLFMGHNCVLEGNNVFGSNCRLGNNSRIINSVIWDNVDIGDNVIVENSIILPNITVEESVYNDVISKNIKEKTEQPV